MLFQRRRLLGMLTALHSGTGMPRACGVRQRWELGQEKAELGHHLLLLLRVGARRGGAAPARRLFFHSSTSEAGGLGSFWDRLSYPPVPSSQQFRGNECFGE